MGKMSRASSVSSEGILLSAQDFSIRKLLPKVQGARRFSDWNLPCILFIKTLLQLPGSQLLSWLFQVCLRHKTELMIENQKHNWRRQITRETAPHSWRRSPSKQRL